MSSEDFEMTPMTSFGQRSYEEQAVRSSISLQL